MDARSTNCTARHRRPGFWHSRYAGDLGEPCQVNATRPRTTGKRHVDLARDSGHQPGIRCQNAGSRDRSAPTPRHLNNREPSRTEVLENSGTFWKNLPGSRDWKKTARPGALGTEQAGCVDRTDLVHRQDRPDGGLTAPAPAGGT